MKEQDVEKQLKESADNIKMKDFSERWEIIKERIRLESENQTVVPCEQKVAVTSGGYNLHNVTTKKVSFAVGLCCLFLAIVLAIVLPLTLKKGSPKRYLAIDDLNSVTVSLDEFETEINKSGIKLIDITKYETSSYRLLYSDNEQLKGGYIDLFDQDNAAVVSLLFHTEDVSTKLKLVSDIITINVNSVNIKYEKIADELTHNFKALADTNSIIYELECIAATDNINPVFEKLFG